MIVVVFDVHVNTYASWNNDYEITIHKHRCFLEGIYSVGLNIKMILEFNAFSNSLMKNM
jgi:hypothetical protein